MIKIQTASVTDKGLNPQKPINEDSLLVLEKEGLLAVADGVGGAHAGDVASQAALQKIEQAFLSDTQNTPKKDPIEFVRKLIQSGNQIIYQLSEKKQHTMASTIALMLIENDYAILGHVGDSRIYVAREGDLTRLTKDHSKLQTLIDNNLITQEEQADFQESNIITKALGVDPDVEADIQKVILKDGDIFLLCTDGIYNHNPEQEILEIIERNRKNLEKICRILHKNCYDRGANDNLTAILVKVSLEREDDTDTKEFQITPEMMKTIRKR